MQIKRPKQMTHFLTWIRQYSGWWYLICTPNDSHMNLQMMKLLLEKLYQEGFYELIFVLLMVHRNDPVMDHVTDYLLLDCLIDQWDKNPSHIFKNLLDLFE